MKIAALDHEADRVVQRRAQRGLAFDGLRDVVRIGPDGAVVMIGGNRVKSAPVPGFAPERAPGRDRAASPLLDARGDFVVEKAHRYWLFC